MRKKKKRKSVFGFILGFSLFICLAVAYLLNYNDDIKKAQYPLPYYEIVKKYSEQYDVPIEIIYAVIKTESSFDKNAISHANAKGLMQLTDDTLDWITRYHLKVEQDLDIFDPELNIMVGTYYLKYAYDRYENWDTVFASYNAGIGRVDSWLKDSRYSEDGISLYYIPYKETREYVVKINNTKNEYIKIYFNKNDSLEGKSS